jgi:uncharacterized protein YjbI with pentapeptide repeats
MADPGHLAKLKEGLKAWDEWRESDSETRPDLSLANLKGANLQGTNFQGTNFRGADLHEADLQGADLQGANLHEADLEGANLQGANLHEADLQGANLKGANLKGARLGGAQLRGANLYSADLKGAGLWLADLQTARLWWANLQGADLQAANLRGAQLWEANLEGANLKGADVRGADLRGVCLDEANVMGVKYNRWARYEGAQVEGCRRNARFKRFASDQQYIEEFRESILRWPLYVIWLVLADCGRSLFLWSAWSAGIAAFFGLIYYRMGEQSFQVHWLPWGLRSMVYYSIVTFTTLGYGDISPKTSEAAQWVSAEVIIGYIMLGGMISILVTKFARRA